MSSPFLYQSEPGLALLKLARPAERNALSFELLESLNEALEQVALDQSLHVAVFLAEGPAFCAGMNLKTVALDDVAQAERFAVLLAETYRRLLLLPIPLLCGVDGPAMGGGVGLALAADVVWAGPNARFAFPETRIGLVPALVSVVARRRLRPTTLCGMALSAAEADASEALRLGLVDHLTPASATAEAERDARRILRENSGSAMRRTKAFLQAQSTETLDRELEAAVAEFRRAASSDACRRGLQAFREKRALTWSD